MVHKESEKQREGERGGKKRGGGKKENHIKLLAVYVCKLNKISKNQKRHAFLAKKRGRKKKEKVEKKITMQ